MTTSPRRRIFISYRRVDSEGYAGRIYDRLADRYGEDAIFMDVDDILVGEDFVEALEEAVQSCDVLIALIGQKWLDIKDETGRLRLKNPKDFVRIEIATALGRNILVIPVLVGGAVMPSSAQLPQNLKSLSRRNAISLDHDSFGADMSRLVAHLNIALQDAEALKALKAKALKKEQERKEKARQAALRRERQQKRIQQTTQFFAGIWKSPVFIVGVVVILLWLGYRTLPFPPLESPTPTNSVSTPIPPTETLSSSENTPVPVSTAEETETPVPSLGVGSTMISEKNDMTMVYVPAGNFLMGSERQNDEKPIHRDYLDAFWIDQTEVTNAMYAKCVATGSCNEPNDTRAHVYGSYYGNPEFDDYPVIWVSWEDANAYCRWAGRRLPTEAQWEKAAGWDETFHSQRMYPWGDTFDGRKVNFCDVNCSYGWSAQNYNDGYESLSPVGSFENGRSFYEAYDMAGNTMEWVDAWYDIYPGGDLNASDYFGTSLKVIRGGSYLSDRYFVSSTRRHWANPKTPFVDVGFRCALSAN